MKFGYCNLSVSPLRKNNDDRSEMISQLLFGETCTILEKKKTWLKIICTHDRYEAWVDKKHITPIESLFDSNHTTFEIAHNYIYKDLHIPLLLGSNLPQFDGLNFKIGKQKILFQGITLENNKENISKIKKIALKYLHAPYLWGGRSPFGIDCSGFSQLVYKFINIKLPRDAYQQAGIGNAIGFVAEARLGDLAFFGDDEKITHVGIVLDENEIIHASGKVRIDRLDHLGIYNRELKKYTHKLRIVKRIVNY